LLEGVLNVRVLQPALHHELERVSTIDILLKLKQGLAVNDPRCAFPNRLRFFILSGMIVSHREADQIIAQDETRLKSASDELDKSGD
jgi:hypothetical protein